MKKRKVGKYNFNRLLAVGGGAIGGLLVNNVVKNYTDNMDAEKQETFAKVWPLIKIGGGAYMASQKNMMVSDAGLGVIAEGAIEAAMVFAPEQFKMSGLSGFWGDSGGWYNDISGAYQNLPLDAGGSRLLDENVADDYEVAGYNHMRGEPMEMDVV